MVDQWNHRTLTSHLVLIPQSVELSEEFDADANQVNILELLIDSIQLSGAPNNARLPAWRRQLRSRMFRTTLAIIIAHILFWLPYNLFALMRYADIDLYERLNVFKELQILIVIVNPFLYGFANGP